MIRKENKRNSLTPRFGFRASLILGTIAAAFAIGYEYQPYRPIVVSGVSMSPTYQDREVLWTTNQLGELKRGDVVIINTESGPIIKRIALLPGEHLYRMTYLGVKADLIEVRPPFSSRRPVERIDVPANCVYVLGDNLTMSVDSRKLGFIPMSAIRGKVLDQRPVPKIPLGLLAAYRIKPIHLGGSGGI